MGSKWELWINMAICCKCLKNYCHVDPWDIWDIWNMRHGIYGTWNLDIISPLKNHWFMYDFQEFWQFPKPIPLHFFGKKTPKKVHGIGFSSRFSGPILMGQEPGLDLGPGGYQPWLSTISSLRPWRIVFIQTLRTLTVLLEIVIFRNPHGVKCYLSRVLVWQMLVRYVLWNTRWSSCNHPCMELYGKHAIFVDRIVFVTPMLFSNPLSFRFARCFRTKCPWWSSLNHVDPHVQCGASKWYVCSL